MNKAQKNPIVPDAERPHARSWFVRAPGPRPRMRLYCFPYAGGQAGMFMCWQHTLGPSVGVCGVELPGRGTRFGELPLASIDAVVEQIARALESEAEIPFALFGHSLGGLIAFELTRHLARNARRLPVHLFISACGSPSRRDTGRKLHLLPNSELLDEVVKFDGTPRAVLENPDLLDVVLPILRADFRLADEYKYGPAPPLAVPMTVLAGLADRSVAADRIEPWAEESTASTHIVWLDGGHFFVDTHRTSVLRCVGRQLAICSSRAPALDSSGSIDDDLRHG